MGNPICSESVKLGIKSDFELEETDFWMPFSFRQLLIWGKCRDFKQDLELDGADDMPQHLIDFATSLMGGLAGSLPGPGTGAPRVGGRVLKVKRLISQNKLPPLSEKRKYDCVRSGSRELDSTTKRLTV